MATLSQTYSGSDARFYLTAPRHIPPDEEGSRNDPAYFEAGCILRWALNADQVTAEVNTRCGPVTKRRAYWNNLDTSSETSPNLLRGDQDFESWNLSVGTDYQQLVEVKEWNTIKATGIRAPGPPSDAVKQRSPDLAQPIGSQLRGSVLIKNETAFYTDFSDWTTEDPAVFNLNQDQIVPEWEAEDATQFSVTSSVSNPAVFISPDHQIGTGNVAVARIYVWNQADQDLTITMVGANPLTPIDGEAVAPGEKEIVTLVGVADADLLHLRISIITSNLPQPFTVWHADIQTSVTLAFEGTDAAPITVSPFQQQLVEWPQVTATATEQAISMAAPASNATLDIIAFDPQAYNLTVIPDGPLTDTGPIRWTLTVQVAAEKMEENHPTVESMFTSFFGLLNNYMAPNPIDKFFSGFDNRDALVYWIASPEEEVPGISQLNSAGRIIAFEQNQDPDGLVTYTFTMRGEYRLDFGTYLDP